MTGPEHEAGITYGELGIDIGRGRGGDIKTHCPKCHGDRRHKADKSLSVNLDTGQWLCHNPGCDWASGLGIEARERGKTPGMGSSATIAPNAAPTPLESRQRPTSAPRKPPETLDPWGMAWLEARGLTRAVVLSAAITSSERPNGERWLHLPYTIDGELVNVKHRMIRDADGEDAKQFRQESGAQRSLFGIDRAREMMRRPNGHKVLVVTEGEFDALACWAAGWAAVSLPDGAVSPGSISEGKLKAIETPEARALFEESDRIIVATDADEPGVATREAIMARIKPEVKLWYVEWPQGIKDANDALSLTGVNGLDQKLAQARPVDLPGIHSFTEDFEDFLDIWEHGFDPGVTTGWPDMDHYWRPRGSTTVVVTGIPSHGKSSFVINLLANLSAIHGWRHALFSPELGRPGSILGKLTQIANERPILPGHDERMSRDDALTGARWVAEHFWRIDNYRRGGEGYASLTPLEILERAEQQHLRVGLNCLVIDPWSRLESQRPRHVSETEYIGQTINAISAFNNRHNIMTIVVAHPTKMEVGRSGEDEGMPSPYNIAGSSHWYNSADIILGVQRNKNTEPKNLTQVRVWKNREEGISGDLGTVRFLYQRDSRRYFCEGTGVPDRLGMNPYSGIPPAFGAAAEEVPTKGWAEGTIWESLDF